MTEIYHRQVQDQRDAMIQLNKLNYRYEVNGPLALKNFSLDIPSGHILGLIGYAGSGKSTLLKCLSTPWRFPENIYARELFPSNIGAVLDTFELFLQINCLENCIQSVQYNCGTSYEEARLRSLQALDLVGYKKFAERLPETLNVEEAYNIRMAQAIASHPKLLLLDEPVYESNYEELLNAFYVLANRGTTIIFSSHTFRFVYSISDTVCQINKGEIDNITKRHNQ